MAQRGEFKVPALPLRAAHELAMEKIDNCSEGVALFMVAGDVRATKKSSTAYEKTLKRLANNLIGVYDQSVDARDLLEDIKQFYREGN